MGETGIVFSMTDLHDAGEENVAPRGVGLPAGAGQLLQEWGQTGTFTLLLTSHAPSRAVQSHGKQLVGVTSPSHSFLSLALSEQRNRLLTAHHRGCSSLPPPSGARSSLGLLSSVAISTWGITSLSQTEQALITLRPRISSADSHDSSWTQPGLPAPFANEHTLWRELGRHRAPTLTPCCASLCGVSLYPSRSRRGEESPLAPAGALAELGKAQD